MASRKGRYLGRISELLKMIQTLEVTVYDPGQPALHCSLEVEPVNDDQRINETEHAVSRIMKTVEMYDKIGKAEFVSILRLVMKEVHGNTGIAVEEVSGTTEKVIEAMPREYGQLSKARRCRRAMITYLYCKYLSELGML